MKRKIALLTIFTVLALCLIPLIASAAGLWSDNFDSYPTGQDLHGVGGWKGWSNDPTFTAFTTDVQARSAPNSVDIASNSDLVHEYSTNSGLVSYRFWQYLPGNLTGQTYFIMLNQYDDAGATNNWSTQVLFDGATGMMVDTGASGATAPYIADQWVEVCVEIDLDNDTQAFNYNGSLVYTGTWSGHVSGGGITAIGAVDLFANGATSAYYDDMSLNMGDCSTPPAAPGVAVSKSPDTQDVTTNGIADFTITVTNTGDITLTTVSLVDALVSDCDNAFGAMAPGFVATYTCQDIAVSGSYTNTIVATGTVPGMPDVTDSDSAYVNYTSPTAVSLSSFGGESTIGGQVWVLALIGSGLAAALFLAYQRRRRLS